MNHSCFILFVHIKYVIRNVSNFIRNSINFLIIYYIKRKLNKRITMKSFLREYSFFHDSQVFTLFF